MSPLRHIRHLRLRAGSASDAQHGRILLEDALRTASLHDDHARLIVIRRLDLGPVSARASATEWSRRLERSYQNAQPAAVRFDDASADDAEAVAFPDSLEPWLQLAVRAVTHRTCDGWFWPLAAPRWSRNLTPEATLCLAFRTLAERGGLRFTLLLAARLRAHGKLNDLLGALRREDVALVQAELLGDSGSPPAPRLPMLGLPPDGAHLTFAFSWGITDPRSRWLAAAALASNASPMNYDPVGLPSRVHAVLTQWTHPRAAPHAAVTPVGVATPATPEQPAPPAVKAEPPPPEPEDLPLEQFTAIAGLFFTVPLLSRAGLPAFLVTLHDDERALYPWHVLHAIARHARAPERDPLLAAMADLPSPPPRVGRWVLAAHRLARRQARMTLRALVVRPGRVALASAHVGIAFRPGDADIRIRCATLDLDPGWVPWLGRTIGFHFNREV